MFTKGLELGATYNTGPICSSLEWLLTQQIHDGSFVEKRPPIHREMHVSAISILRKLLKRIGKALQQKAFFNF